MESARGIQRALVAPRIGHRTKGGITAKMELKGRGNRQMEGSV